MTRVVGYDIAQVEEFVGRLVSALGESPPAIAPEEVRDQRFKARRLRRSYAMEPVDRYLDEAEAALRDATGAAASSDAAPRGGEVRTVWIYVVALVLVLCMVALVILQ